MSWRVIVLTDRRLVPIADIPARLAALLGTVPPGSVAVQVREKDLDGGPLLALVRAVIDVARPAGCEVWVNDRVDVALAAGADGVHLPEHGLSIDAARRLGSLKIGCSRHTRDGVLAAASAGADVVQLGPIHAVPGKSEPLGTEALAIAMPAARLVAVGGIDSPARAADAIRAGAHAVAVIRAAWVTPEVIPAMIKVLE